MKAKTIYLFSNGTVAVFNSRGDQISKYQWAFNNFGLEHELSQQALNEAIELFHVDWALGRFQEKITKEEFIRIIKNKSWEKPLIQEFPKQYGGV